MNSASSISKVSVQGIIAHSQSAVAKSAWEAIKAPDKLAILSIAQWGKGKLAAYASFV